MPERGPGRSTVDRRAFLKGVSAAAIGFTVYPARAQSFPSGVIRIVVPYSVSTPPDILARVVAQALSDGEGWKVIVENKAGGVMTIGAMEVLKAPAGRHTPLFVRDTTTGETGRR